MKNTLYKDLNYFAKGQNILHKDLKHFAKHITHFAQKCQKSFALSVSTKCFQQRHSALHKSKKSQKKIVINHNTKHSKINY
jgi:hypothetical protein